MRVFALGLLSGLMLVRIGATDYDVISGMMRLQDARLAIVMGVAIAVSALGFAWLARRPARLGGPMTVATKPVKPGLVVGALLFGAGWGPTDSCPSTTLAQVGEGRWICLFTLTGIVLGTWLYRRRSAVEEARLLQRQQERAEARGISTVVGGRNRTVAMGAVAPGSEPAQHVVQGARGP